MNQSSFSRRTKVAQHQGLFQLAYSPEVMHCASNFCFPLQSFGYIMKLKCRSAKWNAGLRQNFCRRKHVLTTELQEATIFLELVLFISVLRTENWWNCQFFAFSRQRKMKKIVKYYAHVKKWSSRRRLAYHMQKSHLYWANNKFLLIESSRKNLLKNKKCSR